ncbi:MAG: hypothetical protein OXC44_03680 [Proteobacteria bacterium]|nr:hypothetical protein [Pseudomonadota bacterium]
MFPFRAQHITSIPTRLLVLTYSTLVCSVMIYQGCAVDDSAKSFKQSTQQDSANTTLLKDPTADEANVLPKIQTRLPNTPVTDWDSQLNALRDTVAHDHCIKGDYGREVTASLVLLKCRTTEQQSWLADPLIYDASPPTNSCITQTRDIHSLIIEFAKEGIEAEGAEGWHEYQCKKAADAALEELKAKTEKQAITAEQLTAALQKIIQKTIAFQSDAQSNNILTTLQHTLYKLNNNCADKVVTKDFANTVSQQSSNSRVKASYRYIKIAEDGGSATLPEEDNDEGRKYIDYHVQLAWPKIKEKVKAYQGLVGSTSSTEANASKFSADTNSLTKFLGYSNAYDSSKYSTTTGQTIKQTHNLAPIRELITTCDTDKAYTKMSINTDDEFVTGNFFDHNNFNYKNTDNTSCDTTVKLVLPTVSTATPQTTTSSTTPSSSQALVDSCRIVKGIDYHSDFGFDPNTTFSKFINGQSQMIRPYKNRLHFIIEPIDTSNGTMYSQNKLYNLTSSSFPIQISRRINHHLRNYNPRLKSHDAITCYKEVETVQDCDNQKLDSHYNQLSGDFTSEDNNKAFIHADSDDDTVKQQKRDLYRLNEIKGRLLKSRTGDNHPLKTEPVSILNPYSVYFPNESSSYVKVGGIIMDIDLHKNENNTLATPIPCPTADNKWNSGSSGSPSTDTSANHRGCHQPSATVNSLDVDLKKHDSKYYWDYPDSQVVNSPVCMYFMFINVEDASARSENELAIKKVFDLTDPVITGQPCMNNSEVTYTNSGDFCDQAEDSLSSQAFKNKHTAFCNALQ